MHNAHGLFNIKNGTDLRKVSEAYVEFKMSRISNQPEQSLGVKQPDTIFSKIMKTLLNFGKSVALQS